jgi:myosin-7
MRKIQYQASTYLPLLFRSSTIDSSLLPDSSILPDSSLLSYNARTAARNEPTFALFAQMYFAEMATASYQREQLVVPLLKQIWGDGDAHRVLITWAALLVFTGDAEPSKSQEKFTNLNMVHVITNTGMSRPNTRDEIYCQIFKQITNNPNKFSNARCFIMLALCASVFPPSDMFRPTFLRFIKHNCSEGYLDYLLQQVATTQANFRVRLCPPTALEVYAAFSGKQIAVQVDLHFAKIVVYGACHCTMDGFCCQTLDPAQS